MSHQTFNIKLKPSVGASPLALPVKEGSPPLGATVKMQLIKTKPQNKVRYHFELVTDSGEDRS